MIDLDMARKLKEEGLKWQPILHDLFAIPDSDLDNRLFVVSDMMIDIQQLYGREIITFNGAVEWSLDSIMMADAVWIPNESQLRGLVQFHLADQTDPSLILVGSPRGYSINLVLDSSNYRFEAQNACAVYGQALLFLMDRANT